MHTGDDDTHAMVPGCCCEGGRPIPVASRRKFLGSSAALFASATALTSTMPEPVRAQSAAADSDTELAKLQSARRIVIKNAVILTLDRQVGDFAKGDLLIEDGKIREVGPHIDVAADTAAVVDGANRIVIPGFVDTHSHSYQGLLRGILINGLLDPDYNRDVQTTLTPVYSPDDAYAGVLVTALGMIEAGTTGVVDISQVSHTPEHTDAVIRALQDSGMRAVFSFHRGAGSAAQFPQDIHRLARTYFSSKDQLLTLALTTTLDVKMYQLAREVGVPAVQHIVGKDLSQPVLEIGRAGLLRPGDEFIHCLTVNDEAWRMMKDSGGHVSICAPIDMSMGHGVPAIQAALDYGFRPSLSSDHGTAIATDFFTVMRSTSTLQRMQVLQRKRNGEQNLPALLSCRDLLEFATLDGAICANLGAKVGSLTPGKEADLVVLRVDQPSVWPLNNAPVTVVNLMNPSHVESVFIAGKVKKWHGRLVGVDLPRVMRMVAEARDGVMRRAGFHMDLLG
jgi:5-methylthioadenosine/S-adenosylhomocysteine deaminase